MVKDLKIYNYSFILLQIWNCVNMFSAIRHLYQSCDGYSQCDRNSDCRLLGSIKTCQCMDGYVDINWHCVKCKYLTVNCSVTLWNVTYILAK